MIFLYKPARSGRPYISFLSLNQRESKSSSGVFPHLCKLFGRSLKDNNLQFQELPNIELSGNFREKETISREILLKNIVKIQVIFILD